MKIAIHNRIGSFSERWIEYCQQNNIPFKIVNCYDSDIIEQLKDCDALMWHHHHSKIQDVLFAKQLLYSLEQAGKAVFPDFKSGWYFDDKLGQKYLLEAFDAPLIPTYVFFDESEAIKWANKTTYPKVWKLRGGASGMNVRLVGSNKEAIKLIRKSFRKGFRQFNSKNYFDTRFKRFINGTGSIIDVLKALVRFAYEPANSKLMGKEIGYAYFQDFIPNNKFDNRIIVIGNKAFGIRRLVMKGDFKSSEFNGYYFEKTYIDERCVEIAFDLSKRMNSAFVGFDFIFDENNNPVLAEMGYGFIASVYDKCPGYWTDDMLWHERKFNPQGWMVEDLIKSIDK